MPEMMLVASIAKQVTVAAPAGWMAPRPRLPVASRPRKICLAREVGIKSFIDGNLEAFATYTKIFNK